MKKATKEKKMLNNSKKKNISRNDSKGIFNYDLEVESNKNEINQKKRLTRKVNKRNNINDNQYAINNNRNFVRNSTKEDEKEKRKKIKKIQKKKNKEKAVRKKELERAKKEIKEQQKISTKNRINTKQMKRMRIISKTVKYTFIVFILCTAVVLFVLSPIFNINEITISKNEQITKEEIIGLLNIEKNTNIFKENNKAIKEKLKENPYINVDKTTIRRLLPSTLLISVQERQTEFLLEFGSTYAYIDKDGYILEISSKNIGDKIKIRGYQTSVENIKPGNRLCNEDLDKIYDIIQIVRVSKNYEIYNKITSINMEDKNDYQIFMESEGKTVHLGNNSSIDTKMLYVKAILEKEKDNEGEIFVNVDLNEKNAYFKQKV